jgi:CRAL/TRIO domain
MTSLRQEKAYMFGKDRGGRPVFYIDVGRHVVDEVDFEETKRFVVFYTEHLLAEAGDAVGQFVAVADLSGVGLRNLDLRVPPFLFEVLNAHYTDRLAFLYVLSDSALVSVLWRLVSHLLSDEIKRRIRWGLRHEDLERFIPPHHIPERYGGRGAVPPLDDRLALLHARALASRAALPPTHKAPEPE